MPEPLGAGGRTAGAEGGADAEPCEALKDGLLERGREVDIAVLDVTQSAIHDIALRSGDGSSEL